MISPGGRSPGMGADRGPAIGPAAIDETLRPDPLHRLDPEVEREAAFRPVAVGHQGQILGADPEDAGLGAAPPIGCAAARRSSLIRFIGGAPMKEATKVVAGRR